jgi:competence protein ComEC
MTVLKYPIGIITLFLALGILTGHYSGISLFASCLVCLFAFIALIIVYFYSKKVLLPKPYFIIAASLFAICIGMVTQAVHQPENHKLHYSHFITDDVSVIKGTITERLKPNNYNEKYYFEVSSVDQKPANGRLLLIQPKDSLHSRLNPGDSYIITETPLPIQKSLNPFEFDYAAYMQKQHVLHQIRLKDNHIQTPSVHNLDYYIGSLRESLINSFAIHHFSPQIQNTLNALLFGQRQDMDSETNTAYRDAGVLHILAISGLHFAVLFYVLNYLLGPLKRFKQKGKLIRLLAVLTLLWGFAFITGLSASVVRSVVMFSFISIGQYLNRDTNIYNSLFVSMLLLLITQPGFLFDAGFQLSYLAVFAIVSLQPIYAHIKISKYRGVNYFSDTVLVSIAAQIGVLPLSLYYFNRFPLLFLIANLVVIPLSSIILLLGLLVVILNFVWTDAALALGKLLGFLTGVMNGFIAWVASFESLVVKNISFTAALTFSLYTVIVLFGLWLYKKNHKRTIAVLVSVFAFQIIYMITAWQAKNKEELIVFNNYKSTILGIKDSKTITVMSTDTLAVHNSIIGSYTKANFNPSIRSEPLQNILWYKNKKILVIDKDCSFKKGMQPDIVLLTHSPKLNLERLIIDLHPKQIIADGTNYKNSVQQWKAICLKAKILFHATAEKGYYSIQ